MSTFIFGYGSLINIESLQKTINRKLQANEIFPVQLNGFTRIWNYKAKVFSTKLNKEIDAVYLNIAPFHDSFINGIVFEVNEEELELLKKRERYYSMVEVTPHIKFDQNAKIYTFICYDRLHLAAFHTPCYVLQKYINIVEEGCTNISPNFKTVYDLTTQNIPFEVLEGDYQFR